MQSYFEMLQRRQSCRSYADRPIEREKLDRCIEAARLAPSACNSQPWRYLVVTNQEWIAKLLPCIQALGMNKFANGCHAFIIVVEQPAKLSERPTRLLGSQHFAQFDTGLSVSQLCYEALEQGLSTCVLGGLIESDVKALFELSADERVRVVVAIGYAENDTPREKKRKPVEEIVTYYE